MVSFSTISSPPPAPPTLFFALSGMCEPCLAFDHCFEAIGQSREGRREGGREGGRGKIEGGREKREEEGKEGRKRRKRFGWMEGRREKGSKARGLVTRRGFGIGMGSTKEWIPGLPHPPDKGEIYIQLAMQRTEQQQTIIAFAAGLHRGRGWLVCTEGEGGWDACGRGK